MGFFNNSRKKSEHDIHRIGKMFLRLAGAGSASSYQAALTPGKMPPCNAIMRHSSYQGLLRNPVIVIHGFLGSRLTDVSSGKNVWGEFNPEQMNTPEHYYSLALPFEKNAVNVSNDGILEKSTIKILGMDFELENYSRLISLLMKYGYVREDKELPDGKLFPSLFIFDYDWRRDISESASQLAKFIDEKRNMLRQRYFEIYGVKDYDVKFDIAAHSMGGLVARYYSQYGSSVLPENGTPPLVADNAGNHLGKVILMSTPSAGYLDVFLEMTRGLRFSKFVSPYPSSLLGTFESCYFMLPPSSGRHVVSDRSETASGALDIFDPDLWISNSWGLADTKQDDVLKILMPTITSPETRRNLALSRLTRNLRRAKQFSDALSIPMNKNADFSMHLFCGDAFQTNRTASLDSVTGNLEVIKTDAGDGKILVSSTCYDKREHGSESIFLDSPIPWHSICFISATHMGLFSAPVFERNFMFTLFDSKISNK